MKFIVEGNMRIKGGSRKFVKEIDAQSEKRAKEIVLRSLGSEHRIRESRIKINTVERWEDGER